MIARPGQVHDSLQKMKGFTGVKPGTPMITGVLLKWWVIHPFICILFHLNIIFFNRTTYFTEHIPSYTSAAFSCLFCLSALFPWSILVVLLSYVYTPMSLYIYITSMNHKQEIMCWVIFLFTLTFFFFLSFLHFFPFPSFLHSFLSFLETGYLYIVLEITT